MSDLSLESPIDRLEQQFKALAALVVQGDTDPLRAACEGLQQLALDLLQAIAAAAPNAAPPTHTLHRLKALSQGMAVVRESLLRRAAYIEHALSVVVPTAPHSNYGAAASPYGALARQSGAFKVLAA